ncbi:MAG TPA: hypothetical protein VE404_00030 [Verrucomicrobiae bacterium]|nr:hypothetical protein [Verrucomicrobiae bacterium]
MTQPTRQIVVILCGWAIAASAAGAGAEGKKQPEPGLITATDAIRQAFRMRQAAPLAAALPNPGKIYVSVKIIAAEAGFYSRDQLEALLKQTFATAQTVTFHINIDLSSEDSKDRGVAVCPSVWSYQAHGVRTDLNLRFQLARQQEKWQLVEILEIR